MSYTIALDAMGSAHGIQPSLDASLLCLAQYPWLKIQWVGPYEQLTSQLKLIPKAQQYLLDRINIIDAPDVVNKTDDLQIVLRKKTASSMYVALNQLATQQVDACVSAGSSAGLVALSSHLFSPLDNYQRPAFASYVPTVKGSCLLVDMGANLNPSANQLLQYALLGQALVKTLNTQVNLKIGLLNITQTVGRGMPETQAAHQLLNNHADIDYIGYIEPHQIFEGLVDILVCDGYAGNLVIKSCEGVSRYINQRLRKLIEPWQTTELAKVLTDDLCNNLNAKNFNGAFLLGLPKLVVKSHSRSDAKAMLAALQATIKYLDVHLLDAKTPITND